MTTTVERTNRFEEEAVPHMQSIYRAAVRITGNSSRAEDVTQEVYLNAWKSFDRFTAGTNCRAWLYRILFHTVQHYRRKESRYSLPKNAEENIFAVLPAPVEIPEHLTDEDLLAMVDRLPLAYREVMLLVDIDEFSYREAADVLEVPIGTVMSRLSRARHQMREMIEARAIQKGSVSIIMRSLSLRSV